MGDFAVHEDGLEMRGVLEGVAIEKCEVGVFARLQRAHAVGNPLNPGCPDVSGFLGAIPSQAISGATFKSGQDQREAITNPSLPSL